MSNCGREVVRNESCDSSGAVNGSTEKKQEG